MERDSVVRYLNNSMQFPDVFGMNTDDITMIKYLRAKKGLFTNQDELIRAVRSTKPDRLEDYKSGVYSLLIKEFNIEVLLGQTMIINNINGEQVIGYR